MTPSAFECDALVSRNTTAKAFNGRGASCGHERARAPDVHSGGVDLAANGTGAAQTAKAPIRPVCSGLVRGKITPLFTPAGGNRLAPPSSVKGDDRSTNAAKSRRMRGQVTSRPPLAKVDVEGSNPFSRSTISRGNQPVPRNAEPPKKHGEALNDTARVV